ncbi:MAG: hypothetical protein VB862_09100, partial [Pirellulaceae bacterium]
AHRRTKQRRASAETVWRGQLLIARIAGWHINNIRYKPTPAGTLIWTGCAGFELTGQRVVYPTTVTADIRYTACLGLLLKWFRLQVE